MSDPHKIVIFLPNWIGDVVMATPALAALRQRFSRARLTVFGRPMALETLSGLDTVDEMVTRPASAGVLGGLPGSVNALRSGGHDMAVLLPNSLRSALTARFAGIARVVGYRRDGRRWLLTDSLAPRRDEDGCYEPMSAVEYYLELVALLGAPAVTRQMHLAAEASDVREADELLQSAGVDAGRPTVIINPGASFGVSKMWEPRRFAALADMLISRRGAQIIINAAPNERKIAAEVASEMTGLPLLNFADRDNTIRLLKGLISRSTLMITGDTGARHLAAAMGVGVVTLFGSTDPEWSRIDCPRERIIRVDVPCSPCQRKMCNQPAGPFYHQCMMSITPEMVLLAVEQLLDAPESAEAST